MSHPHRTSRQLLIRYEIKQERTRAIRGLFREKRMTDAEVAEAAETTAFHESAHACVGLALNLPVRAAGIAISPGRVNGGCLLSKDPVTPMEMVALLAEVPEPRPVTVPNGIREIDLLVFLAAGRAAQTKLRGFSDVCWFDEYESEQIIAQMLHSEPWSKDVKLVEAVVAKAAAQHVTTHWRWIQRVAHELIQRRTLTVDQIRALRPSPKATPTERAAAPLEVTA